VLLYETRVFFFFVNECAFSLMALLERVATDFPLRDSILFPPFACDNRLAVGQRYVASHVTLLQFALYFVSIFVFFTRQKGTASVV
jgi:hypothetical protein